MSVDAANARKRSLELLTTARKREERNSRPRHRGLNSPTFRFLCEPFAIASPHPHLVYTSLRASEVVFLACTVDARLNLLKSHGIGAKHLPLPPLPPTVIQGIAMASDNGVGNAASTSPGASGNCTTVVYAFPKEEEDRLVVGYLNEWINAYSFVTSEYYTIGRALLSAGKPTASLSIPPGERALSSCRAWIRQVVCPTKEACRRIFLFFVSA